MNKIVIEVQGGLVQNVYSDIPENEIDIEIIDFDNEERSKKSILKELDKAIKGLVRVW